MDNKTKNIILFSVLSLVVVLINAFSVYGNLFPYHVVRPMFLGVMIIMYISTVKKINKLFLLCQTSTLIAEILHYYSKDVFGLSVLFYTLGLIFLIKAVLEFIKKVNILDFIKYLAFYLVLFSIVFFVTIDRNIDKLYALGYGITFVVVAALIFVNFLKDMTYANLLIFLGITAASISNLILSMRISEVLSDKPILLLTTLTTFLTHYLICLGFIYKEDDIQKKMNN